MSVNLGADCALGFLTEIYLTDAFTRESKFSFNPTPV